MKRLLAILLASLMLLAVLPLAASAETRELKRLAEFSGPFRVNNIVSPRPGQDIAASFKNASVPTTAKYSISSIAWLDKTDNWKAYSSGKFVANHEYVLRVILLPTSGNSFPSNKSTLYGSFTVSYDNSKTKKAYESLGTSNASEASFRVDFGKCEATVTSSATVTGLGTIAIGAKAGDSLANLKVESGNVTISNKYWYDINAEKELGSTDTFVAHHKYRLFIYFVPAAGYKFGTAFSATINGANMNFSNIYYSASMYWDTSELLPNYVLSATVNGYVAPSIGADIAENLSKLSVLYSSDYTIDDKFWGESPSGSSTVTKLTTGKFKAGYRYVLYVSLKTKNPTLNEFKSTVSVKFGSVSVTNVVVVTSTAVAYLDCGELKAQKLSSVSASGAVAPGAGDSVSANLDKIVAPSGANYVIASKYWWDLTDSKTASGNFIVGHNYRLFIYFAPKSEAFEFVDKASMTASLNGTSIANSYISVGNPTTRRGFYKDYGVVEPVSIGNVSVTGFEVPAIGDTVSANIKKLTPANGLFVIDAGTYYWDNTLGKALKDTDKFVADHTYTIHIILAPANENYAFLAPNVMNCLLKDASSTLVASSTDKTLTVASVNGKPKNIGLVYKVGKPKITNIGNVTVNGYKKPTVGEAVDGYLASLNVATDAHFSMVPEYYDNTTNKILKAGDKFVADHEYYLYIYVLPESAAYTFVTAANMKALLKDTSGTTVGNTADSTLEVYGVYGDDAKRSIEFKVGKPEKAKVTNLGNVTVNGYKKPTVGETVDGYLASLNVATDAHFSMVAQYCDTTANEILEAGDKFVADHEYILDIYVLPESDAYTFLTAANMKALLKDTSGTTVGNTADSTLKVYAVYGNDAKRCIKFEVGKPEKGAATVGLLGDVDGNGKIEAKDYMLLKRYCLKTVTLTADQLKRSDINGDGKADAKDYNLLKRHCLKTYTIVQPS